MIDPNTLTTPARRIQIVMTGCVLLLLITTAALAVGVITMPATIGQSLAHMAGFSPGPMQSWQNGALAGIAALHLAVWIVVFDRARRVFGQLATGDPDSAARTASTLSYWLWAMLVWGLIS